MIKLVVSGETLDLFEGTTIELADGLNDIAELNAIGGQFSKEFELPPTPHNLTVLQNAGALNATNGVQYTQIDCWLNEQKGLLQIQRRNWKGAITAVYYSANINWFEAIADLGLRDLDLSALNHTWDVNAIDLARTNTEGYIYAIADYGLFEAIVQEDPTNPLFAYVRAPYLFPSVFAKTIFKQIFADAGFAIQSDWLDTSDEFAKDLVGHNLGKRTNNLAQTAIASYTLTSSEDAFLTALPFPTFLWQMIFEVKANQKNSDLITITPYPNALFKYETERVFVKCKLKFKFRVNLINCNSYTGNISFIIGDYDYVFNVSGTENQDLELNLNTEMLLDFDLVGIKWIISGNGTVASTGGTPRVEFVWLPETVITFEIDDTLLNKQTWDIARNLPDISQADFVKDVMNRYRLLFYQRDNTVFIEPFETLLAKKATAKNLTDLMDISQSSEQSFRLFDYGQNSRLVNSEDTEPVGFGDGLFTIVDKWLAVDLNVYESPFAATGVKDAWVGTTRQRLNVPFIPIWELAEDFEPLYNWRLGKTYNVGDVVAHTDGFYECLISNTSVVPTPTALQWKYLLQVPSKIANTSDREPRYLSLSRGGNQFTQASITLDEQPIYLTQFTSDGSYKKDWQTALDLHYQLFIKAVNDMNVVRVALRIDWLTFATLDWLAPIKLQAPSYGVDGFYLINKLESYQPGINPTAIFELIKLN